MKTEPGEFSFDDLVAAPRSQHHWDGVRNYQARNFMRDEFKRGDLVFIYHSSVAEPKVMGIAEVVREAYPDSFALDPKSPYFDPKSEATGESRWVMVDVAARSRMSQPVTLATMREQPTLQGMALLRPGQRLSIQPVTKDEWDIVVSLGKPCPLLKGQGQRSPRKS